MRPETPLRIALLVYRGKAHCGGQGVYTRHLSKALVDLGHHVEVFSGPPYPDLDPRVRLHQLASLDLYREPDPFRIPHLPRAHRPRRRAGVRAHVHGRLPRAVHVLAAGPPRPRRPPPRLRRRARQPEPRDRPPRHPGASPAGARDPRARHDPPPITVDRRVEIAHAPTLRRNLTLRRWYGFTRMQSRVARLLPRIITVSESSAATSSPTTAWRPSSSGWSRRRRPRQFRPCPAWPGWPGG
jgi:hypothetical protein